MGIAPRGLVARGPEASAAISFLRFQSLVLYIAGSYRREIYKRVCAGAKREAPVACSKHFAELLINHKKPRGRFSKGSGAVGCRSRLPVRSSSYPSVCLPEQGLQSPVRSSFLFVLVSHGHSGSLHQDILLSWGSPWELDQRGSLSRSLRREAFSPFLAAWHC